jgi:hypothetical protein
MDMKPQPEPSAQEVLESNEDQLAWIEPTSGMVIEPHAA